MKSRKLTAQEQQIIDAASKIAEMGIAAGCPAEQMMNFALHDWIGQPKQLQMASAARACDYRCPECTGLYEKGLPIIKGCKKCGPRYVGVGGARGGGKSAWMIAQVTLDDCQRFPGLSFLYIRKSAKTLRAQIRRLLQKTLKPGTYNYREQVGEVSFPNGSMVTIRHFKDESEIDNFLGEEYDGIAYEELTTLSEEKFKNLNSCLRTSKKGWRPRVYASWNWGGVGHQFCRKFFYDPFIQQRQVETRYVLATVSDNRHNNPEYINDLQNFVGWKYQSWYLGNPDLAAGNFFSHYREDVHVYPCACPECKSEATFIKAHGLVKCSQCDLEFNGITFRDEDSVRWWASMDYGSSHPNCFHLFGEDSQGNCFTVAEVHTVDLGISECAEEFRQCLTLHNLDVSDLEAIFSGHDVSKTDRKTKDDGSTIATEYQENGIGLTPITINRVNAFSQMQERLGNVERGKMPTWFIHRLCGNLRSQIQTAQCDEKKPNDILKMNADKETGEGGDDALECFIGTTKIITKRGEIEIKDILRSDEVLTSCGWRKVIRKSFNPDAEVLAVSFSNGAKITGTLNHPIWTDSGWKTLDSLRNGDIIYSCLKQSYSTEPNSVAILNPNISTYGNIIFPAKSKVLAEAFHSMLKSLNTTISSLGCLRASTFITKTETHSTTKLKISNASLECGICPSMEGLGQSRFSGRKWITPESSVTNGKKQMGQKSFSRKISNPRSENASRLEVFSANSAATTTKFSHQITAQSFARHAAKRLKSEKMDDILRKESVKSAEQRSKLTSAEKPQLVVVSVVASNAAGRSGVYNLTVEDCPEYFANGILVHNCARNGIVGAYSSLLTSIKPAQMGAYQSTTRELPENQAVDVESFIVECERLDKEANQI